MTAAGPDVVAPTAHPMAGPTGYTLVAVGCFARIYSGVNAAAMDHCYQILKLTGESSSIKDYYVLQHYASVYAGGWGAMWGEVEAEAFTPQDWVDWSPKGNRTGNCQSFTLSVEVNGWGVTYSTDKCETWSFSKWNPQVHYKNRWTGPVTNTNREIALEIAVQVAQGAWPQWWIPAAVQANG